MNFQSLIVGEKTYSPQTTKLEEDGMENLRTEAMHKTELMFGI